MAFFPLLGHGAALFAASSPDPLPGEGAGEAVASPGSSRTGALSSWCWRGQGGTDRGQHVGGPVGEQTSPPVLGAAAAPQGS